MLFFTTWILAAAGALADAQTYSYSYATEAPTVAPTASLAPTRSETYAPTRFTEAPSYAPTTDTYAPSSFPTITAAPTCNASCPPDILAVPTSMCPEDATDIQPCDACVTFGPGDLCVADPAICPLAPANNCTARYESSGRRLRGASDEEGQTLVYCFPEESGPTPQPTAAPTVQPTAEPTADPTAGPTPGPAPGPTPAPAPAPSPGPTKAPTPGFRYYSKTPNTVGLFCHIADLDNLVVTLGGQTQVVSDFTCYNRCSTGCAAGDTECEDACLNGYLGSDTAVSDAICASTEKVSQICDALASQYGSGADAATKSCGGFDAYKTLDHRHYLNVAGACTVAASGIYDHYVVAQTPTAEPTTEPTSEPTLGPWSGCNWTRSSAVDDGGERELGSADSPGECIGRVRTRCPGWDVARFPEVGSGPCSCRNVTAVTRAAATRRRLGCVDDTSTSDVRGHGCEPWYDEHPHECGAYDDAGFTARRQCCSCQLLGCVDDTSTSDVRGFGCEPWYDENPRKCGWYDDAGFTAKEQCCSCGGGTFPASARLVPLPAAVRHQESSRLVQASSAYSYDYDAGYLDCVVRDAVGHPTAAPTVTAAPTATPMVVAPT